MPKKSKNEIDKKVNHDLRKYLTLSRCYLEKLKDTSISAEEFFVVSLKYDLIFSYLANIYYKRKNLPFTPYGAFYLRRFLETYAIYFAYKEGLLSDTNYKIFKIIAQHRNVGDREGEKLKKQLGLQNIKHLTFQQIMDEDDFIYLRGVTPSATTPLEILQTHDFKDKRHDKQKIIQCYIRCSQMIHYGSFGSTLEKTPLNLTESLNYVDTLIKETLQPDLRNITKLDEMESDKDLEKFGYYYTHVSKFLTNIVETDPFKNNEYLSLPINTLYEYLGDCFLLYSHGMYAPILAFPKIIMETFPIFQELMKLTSFDDQTQRMQNYVDIVDFKFKNASFEIPETKESNELFQRLYKEYVKKFDIKLNFYNFRQTVYTTPTYLIKCECKNFYEVAKYFIHNNSSDFSVRKLNKMYRKSVFLSHGDGLSSSKDFSKQKREALEVIILLLETFQNYLFALRDDYRIKLDEHSKYILSELHNSDVDLVMMYRSITSGIPE